MIGEVTGLELAFRVEDTPMLTVRGYDRRHRLLRGHQTRSFRRMKGSDIARQIADNHGLKAEVEDSGVTFDYLLQHNQSDLAFLQQLAQRIGYEVIVQDSTLLFHARRHGQQEVLTLKRDQNLLEFYPRETTMNQVSRVAVRGWDPQQKATFVGQAGMGDEFTDMAGDVTGPAMGNSAFGAAVMSLVRQPVFSQAEADQLALRQFNTMALQHVTGEGVAIGNTTLRAGVVIRIEGFGRRFSGLYYVLSATHTYTTQTGYQTAFVVRRNAT
jgi:uncharacterized protein